jgi:hypothetical protein
MATQTWTKFANGVWKRYRKPTVADHLRRINDEHEATREATRLRNVANDAEWNEAANQVDPDSQRASHQRPICR